jgi:hypothetical protein
MSQKKEPRYLYFVLDNLELLPWVVLAILQ